MIPPLLRGLCDDAAIFPPGLVPLAAAVRAHREHERSEYAELVGPFVLDVASLDALPPLVADLAPGDLRVSLTVPAPGALAEGLDRLAALPAVHLAAVEVALPPDTDAASALAEIDRLLVVRAGLALRDRPRPPHGPVAGSAAPVAYLEVPRDHRRTGTLEALADTASRAKFRTGGGTAELYPDERELAEAIVATVDLGLAFKATAGLHHAVRNTDPATGFEQHGFLNLLLATEAARQGADAVALVELLAERDGPTIAAAVQDFTPDRAADARASLVSFGTCSITDPLTDLFGLGLLRRSDPSSGGDA